MAMVVIETERVDVKFEAALPSFALMNDDEVGDVVVRVGLKSN